MFDQANHLRQLARDFAATGRASRGPRPRLIGVASGRRGVGVTTVASNLAGALGAMRVETVLLDTAAGDGSDRVARLFGMKPHYTVADVLSGRRELTEVLRPATQGVSVLPGMWGLERLTDFPASAGDHLVAQIERLGSRAAVAMIDLGDDPGALLGRIWQQSDLVLLVTDSDNEAILQTYALIKRMASPEIQTPLRLIVNNVRDQQMAEDVYRRIAQAVQRFLAMRLHAAGWIPRDDLIQAAGRAGDLIVTNARNSEPAGAFQTIASTLAQQMIDLSSGFGPIGRPTPELRTPERKRIA